MSVHLFAFTGAGGSGSTPPAVTRSALAIDAGAVAIPLDAMVHALQLSEDVSTVTANGADSPAETVYAAEVEITAPAAGGPFTLTLPAGWAQFGGAGATLALSAGDPPALLSLRTLADGTVAYSMTQAEAPV